VIVGVGVGVASEAWARGVEASILAGLLSQAQSATAITSTDDRMAKEMIA
jgi:hypothetical protein